MRTSPGFRSVSQILALEPRLLYDAAAAVATEHQQDESQPAHDDTADTHEATRATGKHLLVIDGGLADAQALADSAAPGTTVLVVGSSQDGVTAVGQVLANLGPVDSVQIISHGAPGQFALGSSLLTAHADDTLRTAAWAPCLSADADLLIYGCATADSDSGRALLDALANATGADVAASSNDTGNAENGGDWTLEIATGKIDSELQIAPRALARFEGLLAKVAPTLRIYGGPAAIQHGGQARIRAVITIPSSQAGYDPFIDILLPATSYLSNNGTSFGYARAGETPLFGHFLTFRTDGTVAHPLARDHNGNSVIVRASDYGYQPGDRLAVLEFPQTSFWQRQSAISVDMVLYMSPLAGMDDDRDVRLRAGFRYSWNPVTHPSQNPALFEADWQLVPRWVSRPIGDVNGRPVIRGNVLTYGLDVNEENTLNVVAVRPQQETNVGPVGERLAGRYGAIVMQADGRYLYEIDQDNAAVNAARGQGLVLTEVFIFTYANEYRQQAQANLRFMFDLSVLNHDRTDSHGRFGSVQPDGPGQGSRTAAAIDITSALRDDETLVRPVQDSVVLVPPAQERHRGERSRLATFAEVTLATLAAALGHGDDAFVPGVRTGPFREQIRNRAASALLCTAQPLYGDTMSFGGG